jgi:thiol-disulfide isomerase/thioredoxin
VIGSVSAPRRRSFAAALAASIAIALLSSRALADEPEVISHGGRVELSEHLVAGKLVLFDFYADWCGPCRSIAPRVDELARNRSDRLAVRKVDIVNWGSDVARQYSIRYIPQLKLFGPDGRLIAQGGAGDVLADLERFLADPSAAEKAPTLSPSSRPEDRSQRRSPFPFLAVALGAALLAFLLLPRLASSRRPVPAVAGPRPAWRPRSTVGEERSWFVLADVGIDGPYSRTELEELLRNGLVPPTALVRRRGEHEWRGIEEIGTA